MKKIFLLLALCSTLMYSQLVFSGDIIDSIDNGRIIWHWYESDSSLYVMGEGQLKNQDFYTKVFVDGDSMQIGSWGEFRSFASDVKRVYIGEGITYIGIYTFNEFCNLEEIYLPGTLKLIDFDAFTGCNYHLKKFYMPRNIKMLGCTSLGTNGPFCHSMVIDTLFWDVEDMGSNITYTEFSGVKNVIIGEHVRVLPQSFCSFNDSLTSVEIPCNVLKISGLAFNHCSNLSSVVLNEGLEELENLAFNDCPLLTEIELPKSLRVLNNEFKNVSISEIDIPENVQTVYHLKCSTLRRIRYNARNAKTDGIISLLEDSVELYIGDYVQVINDYCFTGGKVKNVIDIPKSVRYIGESAFNGLKIGTMPPVLDYIGRYAFHAADLGDSLNLPKIGIMEQGAFSNCPSIKKLVINEIDSIKDGAFVSCPLLEYLEVTTTIPSYLGYLPFYNTPISEIIVPNCECIDTYEERWSTAKDTYVNEVSFVSKIPCDDNAREDVISGEGGNRARKSLRNGILIISMPDGRELDVYGKKVNF